VWFWLLVAAVTAAAIVWTYRESPRMIQELRERGKLVPVLLLTSMLPVVWAVIHFGGYDGRWMFVAFYFMALADFVIGGRDLVRQWARLGGGGRASETVYWILMIFILLVLGIAAILVLVGLLVRD